MEERMRGIIVGILLVMYAPKNFVSCVDVSSQINLETDERDLTFGDLQSKDVVDLNKINGQSEFNYLLGELRKRTSDIALGGRPKLLDIINNVQIIINGKEIRPCSDGCDSVCKVSMTSIRNDEGNVITDVHLRIITKPEIDSKVNEIPVVEGVRGVEGSHDHPVVSSRTTTYLRNDIPQIQTRFQDGEPWHQGGRTFQRPQIMWRYHVPVQFTGRLYPQYGVRPAALPVVDDKIEPPLSKTQRNNK